MRRSRANIVLGIAVASWVAIACTAGTSGGPTFDGEGYDRPPVSRDRPPTTGRDSVPLARDVPPVTTDNPGTQGGGSGGGCPPCDGRFRCTTNLGGQTSSTRVTFKSVNGQCRADDDDDVVIVACGGALIQNGTTIGSWTSNGPDSFTATGTGKVNNQPITLSTTCTRDSSTSTPQPIPTSTGTGTIPTANPTGTTDRPPPVIVDAGTSG